MKIMKNGGSFHSYVSLPEGNPSWMGYLWLPIPVRMSKARMRCGRAITMLWSCGSITPDRNTPSQDRDPAVPHRKGVWNTGVSMGFPSHSVPLQCRQWLSSHVVKNSTCLWLLSGGACAWLMASHWNLSNLRKRKPSQSESYAMVSCSSRAVSERNQPRHSARMTKDHITSLRLWSWTPYGTRSGTGSQSLPLRMKNWSET